VVAAWICLAGVLAGLAGLASLRQTRKLRRAGKTAWATIVPAADEPPEKAGRQPRRVMVQFALPDGRVIELPCPRAAGAPDLEPGHKILVWYDPADPADVLVYRRGGRLADGLFIAAGCALLVAGIAVAVFGG
jgi:Protein of unknown function (DUF3592)